MIRPLSIVIRNPTVWGLGAAAVATVSLGAAAVWLMRRKRPTPEELERTRRRFLVQSGRLVDGMLLDVTEVNAEEDRKLSMFIYKYRIGGVDYECSQDVTNLNGVLDARQVRAGFPCTVRYQPGSPQNSIVVAEQWSGLRAGLPSFPAVEPKNAAEVGHLQERRG